MELCSPVDSVISLPSGSKKYISNFTHPTVNVYNGLPCEEKKGKTMINDQYLIKFVAGILKSGSKAEKSQAVTTLTSENIANLEASCPGLTAPPDTPDLIAYGIDKKSLQNPVTGKHEGLSNVASSVSKLGFASAKVTHKKLAYLSNMAPSAFFAPNSTAVFSRRLRMARANHHSKRRNSLYA